MGYRRGRRYGRRRGRKTRYGSGIGRRRNTRRVFSKIGGIRL